MIQLKNYQKNALEKLTLFLAESLLLGPAEAFAKTAQYKIPYKPQEFGETPFACLRLPTGGGKTLLAAYTVGIAARHFICTEAPLVLWLVPTTAIKDQTLDALKKVWHPYRQTLDERFRGQVMVIDMNDITEIKPSDLANKAVIVVGTLATSRVADTSIRNFYAHDEDFDQHFSRMPNGTPDMERINEGPNAGKVKFSFANICHAKRPLVIVDEAHNARTKLSLDTLARVNPACVVEFTATPNTSAENGSNILFSVSASELRAEVMIKLPIILSEHQNWESAVHDAVQTQKKLLELAKNEKEYLRPIALFQAESEGREVTVEVLKNHLVENERIPVEKIAVATGTQRELDGINLFDVACPIEYIITKQALKEGWDCSFAYVFCSVANISSDKDVEQLLGRVLRMPYVKRRFVEQLNNAYAHVSSPSFSMAARQLRDKLVDMGFEEMEVASYLQPYQESLFPEGSAPPVVKEEPLVLELAAAISRSDLPASIADRSTITVDKSGTATLIITGEISEADSVDLVALYKEKQDAKTAKNIFETIRFHRLRQEAAKAPSQRGAVFTVPQLCVAEQEELFLPDRDYFLERAGWDLVSQENGHIITAEEFTIEEQSHSFKVDIEGKQVRYAEIRQENLFDLNEVSTDLTETDLVLFLDNNITVKDVVQVKKQEFLRRAVSYLTGSRKLSLSALIRSRFILARVVAEKIEKARQDAAFYGFSLSLFGAEDIVAVSPENSFSFGTLYEVRDAYKGSYCFSKHFYSLIDDLKPGGEEFECAQSLDRLKELEYWVRNVPRSEYSFRFPTSSGYFYPDFVAKLKNGKTLVVEYKGEHLIDSSDTKEKHMIGELWQRKSGNNAIFLMAVKKDTLGRDIYAQLKAAIAA